MSARVVMPAALAVLFTLVDSSVGKVSTNAAT